MPEVPHMDVCRLSSRWDISRRRMAYTRSLKPQSHQIVRFLDRTIGCDWTSATDRQCLQRSPATRPISTITNDWRISMARAIVGNRATSGSDQRPMYNQSCRPAIDRCLLRPIVRSNVASCERSYEHSCHLASRRTINRFTREPMVWSIVGCNDRSHDQS